MSPPPAPPGRCAVLLQTHFYNPSLARVFRKLKAECPPGYDAFVLLHTPSRKGIPARLERERHHVALTAECRLPAYGRKAGIDAEGRMVPGWSVRDDGHSDLMPLHFHARHPEYDYYWIIEYDVRISGSWTRFLQHFESSAADLLTTTVRSGAEHPNWLYWDTLRTPPAVPPLAPEDRLCCFLPVYRLSRSAMQAIDLAYRQGWAGHAEVTLPTILRQAGLAVEDLGSDGHFVRADNRGRWYSNAPQDLAGTAGSFVAAPPRFVIGRQPDMLWHPVKPLGPMLMDKLRKIPTRLRGLLPRLGVGRRRALAAGQPKLPG